MEPKLAASNLKILLVVEPPRLKNMIVKIGSSSQILGMKIKYGRNHHPEIHFLQIQDHSPTNLQGLIFQILPDFFCVAPGSRIRLPYHDIGLNFGKDHP